MNAREVFRAVGGKNLMTPYTIGYWQTDELAIELSEGTGFSMEPIFGVSTRYRDYENDTSIPTDADGENIGGLFFSKADALDYIEQLEGTRV